MTADDLVIQELAAREADLREANKQLVDLVADLSYENALWRVVYEREHLSRVHGDQTIARLYRILNRQQAA